MRRAAAEDVGTLLKLARMVYFINLPPDERIIGQKIAQSRECFTRVAAYGSDERTEGQIGAVVAGLASDHSDLFMFCVEHSESGGVIGTSQIKARMGGPGNPNYSFKVSSREFKSKSLGVGTTHLIARLFEDVTGPTEVGGLIIQPSFRGHKSKPGRFLSFVRFHFIGLHRPLFAERILAEMMASVSSDGDNLFWDHIGRKFIPVKYSEADRFCQHNRKFIDELMPKDDLYLSLLPLDVLNQVAQVSPETVPARRLLEKLGFEYKGHIDPFDGGPHLEAVAEKVTLVKATRRTTVGGVASDSKRSSYAIVSTMDDDGEFRAISDWVQVDSSGRVCLTREQLEGLSVEAGQDVGITTMDGERGGPAGAGSVKGKKGKANAGVRAASAATPSPEPVESVPARKGRSKKKAGV